MSAEAFQALIASGKPLLVVDLRQDYIYRQWHIAGSVSRDVSEFKRLVQTSPQDFLSRPVVVLCDGGLESEEFATALQGARNQVEYRNPAAFGLSEPAYNLMHAIDNSRRHYGVQPPPEQPVSVVGGVGLLRAKYKDHQLRAVRHVPLSLAEQWAEQGEARLLHLKEKDLTSNPGLADLREFLRLKDGPTVIRYQEGVNADQLELRLSADDTSMRLYTTEAYSNTLLTSNTAIRALSLVRRSFQAVFSEHWVAALLALQVLSTVAFRFWELRLNLRNARPFYVSTPLFGAVFSLGIWFICATHWDWYEVPFGIALTSTSTEFILYVAAALWVALVINGIFPLDPRSMFEPLGESLEETAGQKAKRWLRRIRYRKWIIAFYALVAFALPVLMNEYLNTPLPALLSILIAAYIPFIFDQVFARAIRFGRARRQSSEGQRWLLQLCGVKYGKGEKAFEIESFDPHRPGCIKVTSNGGCLHLGVCSAEIVAAEQSSTPLPDHTREALVLLCHRVFWSLDSDFIVACDAQLSVIEVRAIESTSSPSHVLHCAIFHEAVDGGPDDTLSFDATPWEEQLRNPTPLTTDIVRQRFTEFGATISALKFYAIHPSIQNKPGYHLCHLGNKMYKNVTKEQALLGNSKVGQWVQRFTLIPIMLLFVEQAENEWIHRIEPDYKRQRSKLLSLRGDCAEPGKTLRHIHRLLQKLTARSAIWQEKIALAHVTLYQHIQQVCTELNLDTPSILQQQAGSISAPQTSVMADHGYELYRAQEPVRGDEEVTIPPRLNRLVAAWKTAEQLRQRTQDHYLLQLGAIAELMGPLGERLGIGNTLAFLQLHEFKRVGSPRFQARLAELIAKRKQRWQHRELLDLPARMSIEDLERLDMTAPAAATTETGIQGIRGVRVSGEGFPVRGQATIVANMTDISGATAQSILVVPQIEPKWVPELSAGKIRGIVSERGGMLSHAAILLREAGIPAIMSAQGACQIIESGDLIALASSGEVQKIDDKKANWLWLEQLDAPLQQSSKAARLGVLIGEQLPVPPGVCVSEGVLQACIDSQVTPETDAENSAPQFLEDLQLPEQGMRVLQEIVDTLRFPDGGLIVRSTASIEDRANQTMAGLFRSEGPVDDLNALSEAVCKCWLSKWEFAEHHPASFTLDLIIQHYVIASLGGVLFTRHPVTAEEVFIIEVNEGAAKSVVDGSNIPTRYELDLEGRVRAHEGSTTLPPSLLKSLIEHGKQLQAMFGEAQDIEWVFDGKDLFIVQARDCASVPMESR